MEIFQQFTLPVLQSWRQEEGSTLTCLRCSGLRFRLSVVSYLIATAIWSYRLRRAADWAWRSVANADAPLAYELATAPACRAHLDVSSLRNELEPFESL
jgi:hypothetical protein